MIAPGARLLTIDALDRLLDSHARELAADFTAYRNHTYRVVNLCLAFAPRDEAALEKTVIAAAFHDIGIWTDHTFDYLEPSVRRAVAHLETAGLQAWTAEVTRMIRCHHKVTAVDGEPDSLAECFRRADWVDVSKGLLTCGLPRSVVHDVLATWPAAGFHRRLVELSLKRLRTHPFNPLPMFRW